VKKSKRKPVKRKKYIFGKISKIFLVGVAAIFALYLIVGFSVGSKLLSQDLKDKYGKVLGAVDVSLLVRGMPVKPMVTAVSGCSSSYSFVDLDWADDLGVDTYDIWRNGDLLISGLTALNYHDSNVDLATTYDYYVVATGPVGTNQSDTISLQTAQCYIPSPPPPPANLIITRLDVIDFTNFRCAATTNKKRPTFSGTTNMAGARISIEIRSRREIRKVVSTFYANSNGYWSWRSKGKLKTGDKTAYLTAYDPNDATRSASASLRFKVGKKPSQKFLKKCRITSLLPTMFGGSQPLRLLSEFSLDVEKETKIVHQGEEIRFLLSNPNRQQSAGSPLQIGILDRNENLVFESDGKEGNKIEIDKNLPAGSYKLFARYVSENSDVSAEDNFKVKEKPLLVLGSGREITYRQILGSLGWAAFFSLGLLGIFLLLLLLEYHFSKKAIFQITGSDLKKRGMID
jgi:hypothetical protein